MFGSFTAYQCTTALYTALCNARYNLCHLFGIVLSDCYIIQEKQRFCTTADYIIYAHRNTVYANRIMLIKQKGNFDFRADTVCTRYQYRLIDTRCIKFKQSSKTAYARNNSACHGFRNMGFHQFNGSVTCRNVNTCCFIAVTVTFHCSTLHILNFLRILILSQCMGYIKRIITRKARITYRKTAFFCHFFYTLD